MILHLTEHLDVPLRERNHLLVAAGFAPTYAESTLDSPTMEPVRAAVRQILTAHEPYPAVVVDRHWDLVEANSSIAVLTDGVAPHLLTPPANVLRASLHPDGLAPRIVNLGEWRAHLLGRLRRQIALTADDAAARLYAELSGDSAEEADLPGPGDLAVPLRIRHHGQELVFISMVATFGTPLDITVAELAIESFFPADAATASALRGDQ